MKRLFLLLCLLACFNLPPLLAQVPNDNCGGATFLQLDATGNLCINDGNVGATDDGFNNTCDAGALAPLPPGGHEVWYSYVATGSVNTISVSPLGTNPASQLSVTVINGGCSAIGTNVCNSAIGPFDPATVTFTATPGTPVLFYVTALQSDGEFLVCISSINGFISPGLSCTNATPICNTYDFTSPGSFQPGTSPTPSCFNSPPVRPFWYRFTVASTGPLEFTGFPTNIGGFRWALYDITGGCPGTEVSCNSVYDPFAPFGLSSSVSNCISSPFCPPITVTAGNSYALMVDDTTQSNSGFEFSWVPTVRLLPTAEFTTDTSDGCGSLTVNFTNTSAFISSTTFTLDYGDGSPVVTGNGSNMTLPSHTYGPGNYIVRLTLAQPGGCSNTYSRQIRVKPKPLVTMSVTSDDSLCFDGTNPVSADFAAGTNDPGISYNWIFPGNNGVLITGFGQATAFWNTSGAIAAGLQITVNGCASDTVRDTVYIFDIPTADFSLPDTGCAGTPITVVYTGSAAATANYAWNTGSGTVSNFSNQQFNVSYPFAGNYSISLAVEENGCISFPFIDSVDVFITPVISITNPGPVCEGESVTVNPLATGAPAGSVFTWNFGSSVNTGGSTGNGASGTFNFPVAGTALWTAFAESPEGCVSDTDSVSVIVNPRPAVSFSISDTTLCGSESAVIAYNGPATPPGTVFNWNFSGGNASSAQPQGPYTVNFAAAGTYVISLSINDGQCVSDTLRDTIVNGNSPVALAGNDQTICSLSAANLGAPVQPGYTYNWSPALYLNNPSISNPLATVNYIGNTDTVINYLLTATLGFCSDTDTVILTVNPVQQAFFAPPRPQCFEGNSFSFTPFYGVVPGALIQWVINDDTLAGPVISNYSFDTSGTQNITLLAQTPGCSPDVYSSTVLVKENPVAEFDAAPLEGCIPLEVIFQNLSPSLPGATYLWNFDDSFIDTLNNPVHTYISEGSFLPTLTVTSADTCSGSDTLDSPILVSEVPNALFLAEPQIASTANPFFSFSAVFASSGCLFDFGDGSTDSSCNTTHIYADTGTFTVTLVISNPGGCADTFSLDVRVLEDYSLFLPNAFSPNTDELNDQFRMYGEGIIEFNIKVFNRRGQLVWETDKLNDTWNGTYLNDGSDCPAGIYAYEARVVDSRRKKHVLRNRITLIR